MEGLQRKFPFRKDIAIFVDQVAILVGQTRKVGAHAKLQRQNDSLKYFKIKILIHPVITSKHRWEFYGYGKILDVYS